MRTGVGVEPGSEDEGGLIVLAGATFDPWEEVTTGGLMITVGVDIKLG
jgi:hypothetical protein